MKLLAVFFVVVPIIEMVLLIKVGGVIGVLPTILAVILTAMIGLSLLRAQGVSTMMSARQKMHSGQLPLQEMAEGIFLAVGGALLLTPGFVTDAIGFVCLVPGLRNLVLGKLIAALQSRVHVSGAASRSGHSTIEGEFERERE